MDERLQQYNHKMQKSFDNLLEEFVRGVPIPMCWIN